MQAVAPDVRPKPIPPALWLLVQLLIPIVGVLFLDWNLFGLIYLFWFELILIGLFGLLRILTALGGASPLQGLLARLGSAAFFVILYGALLMIALSFSMVHMDWNSLLGELPTDNRGLGPSTWVLAAVFLLEWLGSYIFSGQYRQAFPLLELFRVFALTLPLAIIIVFVLSPYAQKLEGRHANTVVVLGILLAKTLIAFLVERLPEAFSGIEKSQASS